MTSQQIFRKTIALLILLFLGQPYYTYCQENIEVEGSMVIQNSESVNPVPGTIRWTGSDFEGWNGVIWVSLTGNSSLGTVTDIDGNEYQTTRIGNQEWMAENLKVTQYNDASTIDNVEDSTEWSMQSSGSWCWYNNSSSFNDPYGKLYNWHAVNSGKLCPTGWHVPDDDEWTTLIDYLGGESIAGGKLKEEGLEHWNPPNTGASNESGFTGLPGGQRPFNNSFINFGNAGYWWSSTEVNTTNGWFRLIFLNSASSARFEGDQRSGYSIRCVRD